MTATGSDPRSDSVAINNVSCSSPGCSLGIASVPNLRDVGGYRTDDGSMVRRGLVYRSGHLSRINDSNDDNSRVASLRLRRCFDLRLEGERRKMPDRLPYEPDGSERGTPATVEVWLNVFESVEDELRAAAAGDGDAGSAASLVLEIVANPRMLETCDVSAVNAALGDGKAGALLSLTYKYMVTAESARESYGKLFRSLLGKDNQLPALFHCTAGKDRTGWAGAALLTILGVPRETVLEDFMRSNDYILPRYRSLFDAFVGRGGDASIPHAVFGVTETYLDTAFEEVRSRHGCIEEYFSAALGIDADLQNELRDMLLERQDS